MKFYIRRAVAGLVIAPLVATAYTLGYSLLVFAGATPTTAFADLWVGNGLFIGITLAVVFVFAPQFMRFVAWLERAV